MTRAFRQPVTLVGGGPFTAAALDRAQARAPALVAADQGADRLAAFGAAPDLVVGDMDSISDVAGWRARGAEVLEIAEQDTTDFEKCLYATAAPHYVALGFTGGRMDHTLAVFHAMLARPEKRVVVLGERDAMAFLRPGRTLRLRVGTGARVSLFPFAETRGVRSAGLDWPIEGLTLRPGLQSGTSNRAHSDWIEVGFDRPGCLLMVETGAFEALLDAVAATAPA